MGYTVNLSKEQTINKINLSKNTLKVCLEKKKLSGEKARVAFIIDTSGSMYSYFTSGKAQSIIERILPLALEFDDNGELDMFQFSNYVEDLEPVNMDNIYGYVNSEVMPYFLGEATYYAPPLERILEKYVEDEPSKEYPTYVIFLTDGDNFDEYETERIVKYLSRENVFIQFIGIGYESFSFLKGLDDLPGRYLDNANFFAANDIDRISDEKLYERLMNEYPIWLDQARQKGLVNDHVLKPILDKTHSKDIQRGQKMSLTQAIQNLSKLLVGIDWEVNAPGQAVDIDTSIFMMDANKKTEDDNVVFYNNPRSADGGVEIKADHGTGLKDMFKDMIQLDLKRISSNIEKLAFTITIDEADRRRQSFRMMSQGYFKIIDGEKKAEIFSYKFNENLNMENALVVAEIYRYKNEWKLSPIGSGFTGGLKALCDYYGVDAD